MQKDIMNWALKIEFRRLLTSPTNEYIYFAKILGNSIQIFRAYVTCFIGLKRKLKCIDWIQLMNFWELDYIVTICYHNLTVMKTIFAILFASLLLLLLLSRLTHIQQINIDTINCINIAAFISSILSANIIFQ